MGETCLNYCQRLFGICCERINRLRNWYRHRNSSYGQYSLVDLQQPEEGSSLLEEDSQVEHPYEEETKVIRHE